MIGRVLGAVAATLIIVPAAGWGATALRFRLPPRRLVRGVGVIGWLAFAVIALAGAWWWNPLPAVALFGAGFAVLLRWWTALTPVHDGQWADEVARQTTGTLDGSRVTLHDVRNFDWRSATDYTPRWETRIVDLDRLRSVDMILSYWRGPSIAHMLMSFGFSDSPPIVFSVEIRRKRDQLYSEIGGFFKEFELCVLAGEELDMVRLRTNVRGERVFLYRLRLEPPAVRELFLGYVAEANRLAHAPRFYNTVTGNCTTLVYQMMSRIVGRLPLSHRVLFSGYMPEYVHSIGGLQPNHSLDELRSRGYISDRARQSRGAAEYSADIRRGVPGIDDGISPG